MMKTSFSLNSYWFLTIVLSFVLPRASLAVDTTCPTPGTYPQWYGPHNYLMASQQVLFMVEHAHFTPKVATLMGGESGELEPDINYTLLTIPNHHRALESLSELAIRSKLSKFPKMEYTVPCFFIRASKFVPTDGMINAIYAGYLSRIGQKDFAKTEAESAVKKNPKNPRVAYKVGLAYYYMGDYKTAKVYSDTAKKLGSSAIGLDNLLSKSLTEHH